MCCFCVLIVLDVLDCVEFNDFRVLDVLGVLDGIECVDCATFLTPHWHKLSDFCFGIFLVVNVLDVPGGVERASFFGAGCAGWC